MEKLFVVAYGLDCDGYNSGDITKFTTQFVAQSVADNSNDGSDGLHYSVVDETEAIEYCIRFRRDFDDVNSMVFDENGEIK